MLITVSLRLSLQIGTVIDLTKMKDLRSLGKVFGIKPLLPPPPKDWATAPYNFVSLPKKILPVPFAPVNSFKKYVGEKGDLSGEILLDITALTPLFIGEDTKTFAPTGNPIIPGSSLRGMIKNIFKIVTCGAFRGQSDSQKNGEDFNDEHIYFRCLMSVKKFSWTKALNKLYNERMSEKDSGKKKARPGFLIRRKADGQYFIAPLNKTALPLDKASNPPTGFITIKDFQNRFGAVKFRDSRIHLSGAIAYIVTGNQWAKKTERLLDAAAYDKFKEDLKALRKKLDAGKITKDDYDKKARNHGKQIIRFMSLLYIEPNRENWFEVPEEVQRSYQRDRNRGGVNLFDGKKFLTREDRSEGDLTRAELERRTGQDYPDVDTIIPCYFLTKKNDDGTTVVTAFGHGQCFRIPYENRIGDLVKISGNDAIDFADAVFGKEKFWASRVYFEDATPEKFSELPTATAHPLMQPNPTSYQLYLKQDDGELKHWDSPATQIRGYKLYWHNAAPDWHATDNERALDRGKSDDKRLTKEITPLAEGSNFAAKIRFKNLSAVELGALMMVFDLDGLKNPAYKIGRGKTFGFGSVRITPKLFVEEEDAYTEIFDGDGWKNPCREKNPAEYLDAFRKYLKTCNMYETWQKVMDELKMMLDWSQTEHEGWSEYVKPMSGNVSQTDDVDDRFIKRAPLPTIFDVVK